MDTKTPRWTEQQLADYLQCAKDTVRRMRLDGTGPPFTRFGRRGLVRYDPDEVYAWEQESKHNVNGAA